MSSRRSAGPGHITVMGAVNWDTTIFEEEFPLPGEEASVLSVEEGPGGKGGNVAVAAARILGGGRVSLVGEVGDDSVGKTQARILREEGVATEGLLTTGMSSSGRAYIVVDRRGRKTIHSHLGANDALLPSLLTSRRVLHEISRASILVLMDAPIRTALKAAKLAMGLGSTVVYSPGLRSGGGFGSIKEILDHADILVVDTGELRKLRGGTSVATWVARLCTSFPRLTFVATQGPKGCLVAKGRSSATVPGVDLSAIGLKAVNSTGSGDAFLGAFACSLLADRRPLEALPWANLAGALKATRRETRGSPTKVDLEEAMARLRRSDGGNRAG